MLLHFCVVYILYHLNYVYTQWRAKKHINKKARSMHAIAKPYKCNTSGRHNMQLQEHEANHFKSVT